MGTTIGIVLYPDSEELDWVGPFEVFGMAAMGRDVEVVTIAETTEPARGAKGHRITTHWGYIEALRERAEVREERATGAPTWRDEHLDLT